MSKRSKEKKKMNKLEFGFTIFSLIFLIGFSCFYAYRLFYYKNKLAPKTDDGKKIVLLSDIIKEKVTTTNDGLYNEENNFIFKGNKVNNYIQYANMLFRIVKVNKDNSIDIVLDEPINYLSYDLEETNYYESNLRKYLNEDFYNNISSNLLIKSPYCIDSIKDPNKITCNNIKVDAVKLLSVSDYLNSKKDGISYLTNEGTSWLLNNNTESVYSLTNGNLSYSKPNEIHQVKPVITLNNLISYKEGDGSQENPYTIDTDKIYFASYVKLDNDLYRVYETKDNILKLQLELIYKNGDIKNELSKTTNTFTNEEGLGNYLNTTVYNTLTYKDLLEECETYTGEYNSNYENVKNTSIKNKIVINNILDPIFNKEKNNYYLSTPYETDKTYIFNEELYPTKANIVRNISFSICIDKNKLTKGKGTKEEPYTVVNEVQE